MSADIELIPSGKNIWQLSGKLNFHTISEAWARLLPVISIPGAFTLSLSGVTSANSAALALLFEAKEKAEQSDCALTYTDLPDELLALAKMSNCQQLLLG